MTTLSCRSTPATMDKFAGSVDFMPYANSLWEGISSAVTTLPDIVAKSNSTPSILPLRVVLTPHACFSPILKQNQIAIDSIIMCIEPTSEDKPLDAAVDEFVSPSFHTEKRRRQQSQQYR